MKIFDLDLNNIEAAKATMAEALDTSGQKLIRIYITKPRSVSMVEKEAKAQEKTDKKAAAAKTKEEKTAAKAEKAATKAAKKASKETTAETAPAPDIKKAAEKAINATTKKSHHNPAKGY